MFSEFVYFYFIGKTKKSTNKFLINEINLKKLVIAQRITTISSIILPTIIINIILKTDIRISLKVSISLIVIVVIHFLMMKVLFGLFNYFKRKERENIYVKR